VLFVVTRQLVNIMESALVKGAKDFSSALYSEEQNMFAWQIGTVLWTKGGGIGVSFADSRNVSR